MIEPGADDIKVRQYIYSLIDITSAKSILDIGCGTGYDLKQIAKLTQKRMRLVGIDTSRKKIEAAHIATKNDAYFSFFIRDVSSGLLFKNGEFDVVYSKNLLECIPNKETLIKEVHRVLRSNGQVLFAHWDWDSQVIDGENKALVRKIIHRFSDWKQKWMANCDSWMGRRLWRTFNRTDLFKGNIYTYALTNTNFCAPYYGYARIKDFETLVSKGMIRKEEYEAFYKDIVNLSQGGEYFYSITMYIYVGRKT